MASSPERTLEVLLEGELEVDAEPGRGFSLGSRSGQFTVEFPDFRTAWTVGTQLRAAFRALAVCFDLENGAGLAVRPIAVRIRQRNVAFVRFRESRIRVRLTPVRFLTGLAG